MTCPAFIISYWEVLEEEKDYVDNKLKFREILMRELESALPVTF